MGSQHPNIAPYGDIVISKNGTPILLGLGTQRQFESFCQSLEAHHILDNPHFESNQDRLTNRQELISAIQKVVELFDDNQLQMLKTQSNLNMAFIRNLKEVLTDPKSKSLILEYPNKMKCVRTAVFKVEN